MSRVRRLGSFEDLLLDGLQVEAGPLLHRRELDERLAEPGDFLLDVNESPELVGVPIVEIDRSGQARLNGWLGGTVKPGWPILTNIRLDPFERTSHPAEMAGAPTDAPDRPAVGAGSCR